MPLATPLWILSRSNIAPSAFSFSTSGSPPGARHAYVERPLLRAGRTCNLPCYSLSLRYATPHPCAVRWFCHRPETDASVADAADQPLLFVCAHKVTFDQPSLYLSGRWRRLRTHYSSSQRHFTVAVSFSPSATQHSLLYHLAVHRIFALPSLRVARFRVVLNG